MKICQKRPLPDLDLESRLEILKSSLDINTDISAKLAKNLLVKKKPVGKKKSNRTNKTSSSTKPQKVHTKKPSQEKLLTTNVSNITGNSSSNEHNLSGIKNDQLSLSKLSSDSNNNTTNNNNKSSDVSINTSQQQAADCLENVPTQITCTTYARSYLKAPYGWLIDFINYFGQQNGFQLLLERFTNSVKLSIQVIAALLK